MATGPGRSELATAALSADQTDRRAQDLFRTARGWVENPDAVVNEDLAEHFCSRPFEDFQLVADKAYLCCSTWLPVPIGDYRRETPEAIWNSATAQEVRRSILDGDFRYCSKLHCALLVNRSLPKRSEVTNRLHRQIMAERLTTLPWRPKRVLLSHDRSCNLSCPSCRQELVAAKKAEVARLNRLFETTIAPLLRDADSVHVTGSGDAFGSAHFRYVLKRLNRAEFPQLRLMLQTNGVLFDRKAWDELELEGLVHGVLVSIDAACRATYEVIRRGGSFDRLLDNLAFIGESAARRADPPFPPRLRRPGVELPRDAGRDRARARLRLRRDAFPDDPQLAHLQPGRVPAAFHRLARPSVLRRVPAGAAAPESGPADGQADHGPPPARICPAPAGRGRLG